MSNLTKDGATSHAVADLVYAGTDLGQVRAVADHLPLLVWSCLPDGACDYLSRGWVEYTGVPEADHHGRGWLDAVHPDDRPRTRVGWEAFVAGRAAYDVDYRLRRHDGAYRWFKTRGVLVRGAGGAPARVLGTTTDVDDQKRAEERDRESRERLEAALAASGTGTFRWDLATDALDWDEQLDRLFGLPPGQTVRSLEKFLARVHPDDRAGVVERCRRCAEAGADFAMEFRVVRPDGSVRWLDDRGRTVRDAAGRPAYMTGACVDVTDRRRAADALREASATLRGFYDTAPVMMGVVEVRGGDVVHLTDNAATHRFFGAAPDALAGRRASELGVPPDHLGEWVWRYRESERTGSPVRFEYPHRTPAGVRWVSAIVSCIERLPGGGCRCSYVAEDVTDRKAADDRLRRAEERFRAAVAATSEILWTSDPAGRMTADQPGWGAFTGQTPDEYREDGWAAAVHPADAEPTIAAWNTAVAERRPFMFEHRVRRRDGEYRAFSVRAVPVLGPDGAVREWVGTHTDVTDRQRAAEALRASEARFRQLADAMPQIVWTAGPDGQIDYLNRRWTEFSGRPAAGNAGWDPLLHPDEAAVAASRWAESVRTGEPFEMELRLRDRRDGAYRWHLIRTVAARDADGRVGRWFGTATDIDAQKRAEQTIRSLLRVSERLNASLDVDVLLDALVQEAIALADAESGVAGLRTADGMTCKRYFQKGAVLPLEYCWPPLHGLPGWLIVHKVPYLTNDARADPQIVHELCGRFGVRSALSTPILDARGEVLGFFEVHNKQSPAGFGPGDRELLLAVSRSAAAAIQNALAYRELQRAEAALKEADRRKDEFLALLAHELRNPLAPLRNGLQVMKLAGELPPPAAAARAMMERQLGHMVRLIDDLLDVSRITRGKLDLRRARVALADVVASAVETARPLIEQAGHALAVSLPPDPVDLDADLTRLSQVFANLLANSAKYTEPGGRIDLAAARDGAQVVVTVRDTGVGIPPAALPTVFDMFSQVGRAPGRASEGLGLGLAIVKGLVEMHGGTVAAFSDGPGRGSLFTVRLPAPEAAPEPRPAAAPGSPDGVGPRRRILVVDDNRDVAESTALMLSLLGNEVHLAHDGLDGIAAAERVRPDVILIDVGMPRLNGLDAARRIRQQPWGRDVTIVALTGWGQDADRARSQGAGCDGHLVKPVDPAALQAILSTAPQGR